jgi:uncharacterized protein (DUF1778 family)
VLQRAADIRHQTLTEFVLGSAYDRAMTTILDDTMLRLSERDGEAFASALSEPGPIKKAVLARFRAASKSDRRRPRPAMRTRSAGSIRTRKGEGNADDAEPGSALMSSGSFF